MSSKNIIFPEILLDLMTFSIRFSIGQGTNFSLADAVGYTNFAPCTMYPSKQVSPQVTHLTLGMSLDLSLLAQN